MEKELRLDLPHEQASEDFGELLGGLLQAGDCVTLIGELGTGKTTTCRGIGRGLGCHEPLRSPTYLLCHEVDGPIPVLHLDAYFEVRMDSLLAEGLCERFQEDCVLLVEWADRLESWWPRDRLEIRLQVAETGRQAALRALGVRAGVRLESLRELLERVNFP